MSNQYPKNLCTGRWKISHEMMAIMYHYVRPGPSSPPYEYYYLDLESFRAQLDYLEREFDIIDKDTFVSAVEGDRTPPENAVILTFDDGLADHHKWVLPELRERGLWGYFFVPGPIGDDLLPVHRIHTLLGVAESEELLGALFDIAETQLAEHKIDQLDVSRANSDNPMSIFKEILTYNLPYNILTDTLEMLENRFPEATVDPESFYLTTSQLSDLSNSGMMIGGHTVSHPVLSRLSPSAQSEEIKKSMTFVTEGVETQQLQGFAYPYGTAATFDEETLAVVERQGCDIAFTTESRNITQADIRDRPLQLPRRDTNEFPHGSASRY